MNLQELKHLIEIERSRAYKLKTKKAQEKAWTKIRDLEREALDILFVKVKRYQKHSIKGIVKHFRAKDEHFLVETIFGSMWLTPTADESSKSWYPSTCCIEYTEGQEIIIEIDTEVNMDKLFLELIPKRTYGGKVNEEQYAELCKRGNLAFFKYPDGHMSGLFASKKESA
jgi:hypothetical protein